MAPIARNSTSAAVGLAAAFVVLFFSACESPTAPGVPFRVLESLWLATSPSCAPGVRVVRSPADWGAHGFAFTGDPPAVDFSREIAVIVSAGPRPSSGYAVEVRGVRRGLSKIVVEAEELTVGRCGGLTVITCPRAILAVPRTERPVDLEWVSIRPRPGCE